MTAVPPDPAVPVVVIGGYLGAGKTTLVNHLLRTGTGVRTLVLVNDFGAVSVDADLVEADDGDVLTLTNGCVCCSLSSPLADTFEAIRSMPERPELLVVETSGVADPVPVSHHALTPGFRLDGIIVVADAETVRRRADDDLVGRTVRRQLAGADLVVLNKTDLVPPARVDALGAWLADASPGARWVPAVGARVSPALVLGAGSPGAGAQARTVDAGALAEHDTWTWTPAGLVDRVALLAVLDDLPAGVVRAKGVVAFADDPDHPAVVQVVGTRRSVEAGGARAAVPPGRLVLVGLPGTLDPADLAARFERAASSIRPG